MVSTFKDRMESTSSIYKIYRVVSTSKSRWRVLLRYTEYIGMVSTYKDRMESTSLIYRLYRVVSTFKDRMESISSIYRIPYR